MSRRGPPRPNPLPLTKPRPLQSGAGSGSVVPDPPVENIVSAIETLREKGLSQDVVKEKLKVLQVVVWNHRVKGTHKWVELDRSATTAKLEEAWKASLTIAIKSGEPVCRICELETAQHPFCSKTGKPHPTLPMKDYEDYRRTYILPGKVKELLSGKHLNDLVEIMRVNMNNIEAVVFAIMVMTETTSPKLAVDARKKELLEAGAIPLIIEAIDTYLPYEVVAQDACAVLRNLLTHIPTTMQFAQLGGAKRLLGCVNKYPINQELVHRTCGCLLILASRGADARKNLFEQGIVDTLVKVLETPHGREHMVRRLVVTTFQKLIASIPKEPFRKAMDAVKGFTIMNQLLNATRDDDYRGMQEVLAVRGDLPRGTFVDPNVLIIDDQGGTHHESFVQMMKSNEHRDYTDDPPTPKLIPASWPAASVASPLFPSPPSFGAGDLEDDSDDYCSASNEFPAKPSQSIATKVQKARTPGAPQVHQSSLPDVAMADDDLAVYTTSHDITTPGTLAQITSDTQLLSSMLHHTMAEPRAVAVAKKTLAFLDAEFTPRGTFNRTPPYAQQLYKYLEVLVDESVAILKKGPKLIDVKAPVYVFGDIHGNFGDLQYFMHNLTVMKDLAYSPYSFLFVGDYVDRGHWGPEVMAYLLAMKVIAPADVIMLRGNHEDVVVNGDTELYGDGCFKNQCRQCFQSLGLDKAHRLFDRINASFKHFPIAAVIDNKIFATHGGIPRFGGGDDIRMETLRDPNFEAFDDFILPYELNMNDKKTRQHVYAHDCIWSDPSHQGERLDEFGFGRSSRGGQVVSYGQAAIHSFLDNTGMEFIIRGHEEKADGLNISKQARVLTVFSTSDYCRKGNRAGVALVRVLGNGDHVCRMIHRAKPASQQSAY